MFVCMLMKFKFQMIILIIIIGFAILRIKKVVYSYFNCEKDMMMIMMNGRWVGWFFIFMNESRYAVKIKVFGLF